MPFPVSVKNEIAEIFKKNGFECMSPGRGSQNPENWKGLGFHRARDNAWAVLSQGETITLRLNHYDAAIAGAEESVNKRTGGSAHKPFIDKFKDYPGMAVECLNTGVVEKVIAQYEM